MGNFSQNDLIILCLILIIIVACYFWNKAVKELEDNKKSCKLLDKILRNMIGGRMEGIGGYVTFTSGVEKDSPIRLVKGIMFRSKEGLDDQPQNWNKIRDMVDKWADEIVSREDVELDS